MILAKMMSKYYFVDYISLKKHFQLVPLVGLPNVMVKKVFNAQVNCGKFELTKIKQDCLL